MHASTHLALERLKADGKPVVVAFSAGKDSLVCADLLQRAGIPWVATYWYLVPNLVCESGVRERAREMGAIGFHTMPHQMTVFYMKNGWLGSNPALAERFRADYKNIDAITAARKQFGATWGEVGAKRADSMTRHAFLGPFHDGLDHRSHLAYPVRDWTMKEVLAYLDARRIHVDRRGRSQGFSLQEGDLLWIHDHFPDDFARILEVFPGAADFVARRALMPEMYAPKPRKPRQRKAKAHTKRQRMTLKGKPRKPVKAGQATPMVE